MRLRMDPRVSDLAGTGLVLIGFLLIAMAVSAAPTLLKSLSGHGSAAPAVSPPAGPGGVLS